MKYIGYWIDSLKDDKYCPPQAFVGEMKADGKATIVEYLLSGTVFEQYRGFSWCRFRCGVANSEMGFQDLTDGVWVWPDGLAHYVEHHNVILPKEFTEHARNNSRVAFDSTNRPRDEFWVEWSHRNTPKEFNRELTLARERADRKYVEKRRAYFRKLENELGLSDTNCHFKDCKNRALLNTLLCAECANRNEQYDPGDSAFHDGLLDVMNRLTKS